METGTDSEDDRARLDSSRAMSVEAYRALLTQRLRAEGGVGADAPEHAELVFNLTRLHTRISQDFEVLHRRRGWTWSGFRIMNVLWVFGTVEQRDVARLSGGSRAAISSALNTLQRDGLVNRIRDNLDRRLVRLELTERGLSALRDAIHGQADRERQWLSVLDSSDQRLLSQLLATVADRRAP
jgi:DNA-binding MarR family transcriptional regulator